MVTAFPSRAQGPWAGEGRVPSGLLSPDSLGTLGKLTLSGCSFPYLGSQGQMLLRLP